MSWLAEFDWRRCRVHIAYAAFDHQGRVVIPCRACKLEAEIALARLNGRKGA